LTVRFMRKPLRRSLCTWVTIGPAAGIPDYGHSGSLALDRPVCFNGAVGRQTGLPRLRE
jgi:hypothetical protein